MVPKKWQNMIKHETGTTLAKHEQKHDKKPMNLSYQARFDTRGWSQVKTLFCTGKKVFHLGIFVSIPGGHQFGQVVKVEN